MIDTHTHTHTHNFIFNHFNLLSFIMKDTNVFCEVLKVVSMYRSAGITAFKCEPTQMNIASINTSFENRQFGVSSDACLFLVL